MGLNAYHEQPQMSQWVLQGQTCRRHHRHPNKVTPATPFLPRSQILQVIPCTDGGNTRLIQSFAMENTRKSPEKPKKAWSCRSAPAIEGISAGRPGLATCREPTVPGGPRRGPITHSHSRETLSTSIFSDGAHGNILLDLSAWAVAFHLKSSI